MTAGAAFRRSFGRKSHQKTVAQAFDAPYLVVLHRLCQNDGGILQTTITIFSSLVQFAIKMGKKWVVSSLYQPDFRAIFIVKRFSYRFVIIVDLGNICCEVAQKTDV